MTKTLFQPRCIKDNRAHCTRDESLPEVLAGNCSLQGWTVPGMWVGRSSPGCAPAPARMLNVCSDGYSEAWGNRASVSRCGALGNTWLLLTDEQVVWGSTSPGKREHRELSRFPVKVTVWPHTSKKCTRLDPTPSPFTHRSSPHKCCYLLQFALHACGTSCTCLQRPSALM